MIHLSCENVRRLWFVLLWILCIQAANGQEFTAGYVTYLPRGSGEVAVKKIAVPEISAAGSDTIVVDIPERVASGGAEYAVTAIGTGAGCGSVMEYGKNAPYNIVRIPSTVRDVYAGTFASAPSVSTRTTSLVFLPNRNIKFDNDFTIRHAGIDTKVERGSDYGYYVVVFNEGKDVIDYVDLQFGDDAVKHTVMTCIYPGHDAVLTDEALYTASLENGIEPRVTPHFNESALKARTYAQAKAATAGARMVNRRRASRGLKSPVAMPKVQLQVVDIDVSPLSVLVAGSDNYYEASADTLISVPDVEPGEYSDQLPDDYTTVLLNVMNDSSIRLKPGYTTNISLYYDIKGQRPYEYAHGVEIPAAQFEADGGSTVARILVGKVPESVMLFAVAHTTDAEGNIVKDQNMVNNASPVRLERNSLEEVPDGIDTVVADKDDDTQPSFEVCRTEGGALVSGLAEGQTLRVYDMSGSMLHLYLEKSAGGQHLVRLGKHGVYLFSVGKHTVRLAF